MQIIYLFINIKYINKKILSIYKLDINYSYYYLKFQSLQ